MKIGILKSVVHYWSETQDDRKTKIYASKLACLKQNNFI